MREIWPYGIVTCEPERDLRKDERSLVQPVLSLVPMSLCATIRATFLFMDLISPLGDFLVRGFAAQARVKGCSRYEIGAIAVVGSHSNLSFGSSLRIRDREISAIASESRSF